MYFQKITAEKEKKKQTNEKKNQNKLKKTKKKQNSQMKNNSLPDTKLFCFTCYNCE